MVPQIQPTDLKRMLDAGSTGAAAGRAATGGARAIARCRGAC